VQAKAEAKVEPEVPYAPKAETKEHITATQPKAVHVEALALIEEQEESSSETPIEDGILEMPMIEEDSD
jgi:hypothetical protein